MINSNYKRCPRCGTKTASLSKQCPVCQLKYDRIENLSNKEAKIAIKNKEKENVLYLAKRPNDVDKRKFYLYFFLLGFFGAHNIYVGKYKRGYYSLISILVFLLFFIFSQILNYCEVDTTFLDYYVTMPLCLFAVFGMFIWFMDFTSLMCKSYKYPSAMSKQDYIKFAIKSNKFASGHKMSKIKNNTNTNKG